MGSVAGGGGRGGGEGGEGGLAVFATCWPWVSGRTQIALRKFHMFRRVLARHAGSKSLELMHCPHLLVDSTLQNVCLPRQKHARSMLNTVGSTVNLTFSSWLVERRVSKEGLAGVDTLVSQAVHPQAQTSRCLVSMSR